MCILAGEPENVNARFDVVGFDAAGRCRLLIGENLPLDAAIARMRGFNSGESSRYVASVVPHGSFPICEGESGGQMPPMPHLMTARDFVSLSVNDWIHRYFGGFEDEVADAVTVRAEAESCATLASRGVLLSGDETLQEMCCLMTVEEQYSIWRRSLDLDTADLQTA